MSAPVRVQLTRRKGWRMPPNTVNVARPSKWGNPFKIGHFNVPDAAAAVELFRLAVLTGLVVGPLDPSELRGRNLACWCRPDAPCHADVLLELANQ